MGGGEWIDGEPEERVEDLNGWTRLMFGLRIGGADPKMVINGYVNARGER